VERICGREILHTVVDAEPLGPKIRLDAMIICPCTGNTLAKLANGITDTAVCMAAKAHLRSDRPLIISLASNDALSANLRNIATLLSKKHVYFVPMNQDDPEKKPHSLVADFSKLTDTLHAAMEGRQFRRLFL
jgi:dipicolinate synthase subunit B